MKKIVAGSLLLIAPALASADGASGCGWGALLFDGNSGLVPHVLAVTTNNSSGNNTFGMTSGTNGCTYQETIQYKGAKRVVDANMTKLAQDISRGDGEILAALAEVLGIQAQDKPIFYRALQENFSLIYPHDSVTSSEVTASIIKVMQGQAALAKYTG